MTLTAPAVQSTGARHRWAVILAGGDGTRLRSLTRQISGDDRPKQFCCVLGQETLLQQTQRRTARLIPAEQTLLVMTKGHEAFYANQLAEVGDSEILIQPSNRGTAPAILHSLLRLNEIDRDGVVGIFPSDHYFSSDATRQSYGTSLQLGSPLGTSDLAGDSAERTGRGVWVD